MLISLTCIANSHTMLGRNEQASNMLRGVYSGRVRLNGEEHEDTIIAALNYATSLASLRRFEEAKSLLCKTIPVERRVQRGVDENTLRLRWNYARALREADGATLDDLREALTTLEETAPIARRVLGSSHPLALSIENYLQDAHDSVRAREASRA